MNKKNEEVDYNKEHRKRLRKKFDDSNGEALADYEMLEILLFQYLPRKDTKPLAKDLLKKFGSLSGVLGASEQQLKEVDGIGEAIAHQLKVVYAILGRTFKSEISEKPLLDNWSALIDYCNSVMAQKDIEEFRVLFVDTKNRLITDEVQQTGTVNHTSVYPREVVKRALALNASGFVLVHNHPSGDPTPSQADIEMTRKIVEACKNMEIIVHDHIIIAKSGHASFRGMKLL